MSYLSYLMAEYGRLSCRHVIPSLSEAPQELQAPVADEDERSQRRSGCFHRDDRDQHHATRRVPDSRLKIQEYHGVSK